MRNFIFLVFVTLMGCSLHTCQLTNTKPPGTPWNALSHCSSTPRS